jgi:acetyl esterase
MEPDEGRLPWRLRALFAVAGTAGVLRLAPPVEALPSQPLDRRKKQGQTPAWIRGRVEDDVEHQDHVADTPAGPLRIRLYRPTASTGALPVLAYLHGGGWVTGSIETTDTICAALAAKAKVCVASIDYRLAPEAPYPAALDDAEAGLLWLIEHADALALNVASVSVGGDSAGGNLAAALAIRLRDSSRVVLSSQVLLYPVLDGTLSCPSMREFDGWGLRVRDMTVFRDAYAGSADLSDPGLSPLLVPETAGLPPAYVVTAGLDCLRDEGHRYASRLSAEGVDVRYAHYKDLPHGFLSLAGLCREAGEVLEEAAAFVRGTFGRV